MKRLEPGSRIGIIGGGPAGTFCAHFLLHYSRMKDLPVTVTIYESKAFETAGRGGCNLCVGILAHSLLEKLSAIGLEVPESIIQRSIEYYRLITEFGEITLEKDPDRRIYTVYRGGGPKGFKFVEPVSFDNFLLDSARAAGAEVKSCTIIDVQPPGSARDPIRLRGRCGEEYEEDVLVGAFGVNSPMASVFEKMSLGYVPPRTSTAYQAEFHLGEAFITERFKNTVLVFLLPMKKLDFGIIAPKKSQVTVSIVGRNLTHSDMDGFLAHPLVRRVFPAGWRPSPEYCYCRPKLPVTPAVKPYGNRVVVIGDACISRYYKNGIQSAYFTAEFAAKTIFDHGIDEQAFENNFWSLCRRKYLYDNMYGKALFRSSFLVKRSRYMSDVMLGVASGRLSREERNASKLRKVYWNMFTGNAPYYYILKDLLSPGLQLDIWKATLNPFRKGTKRDGDRPGSPA